jgi:poly(hydroxyalkanoate) depolymerase family esterase
MKLNEDFLLQMRDATALLQRDGPAAATAAIQRALRGESAPHVAVNTMRASDDSVIDVDVIEKRAPDRAEFLSASLRNHAGSREYKIFIPRSYNEASGNVHPLIIMLHGCKQNPDDFASGTQMNEVAEEHGCIVVYPAQSQAKNMSNCWNWFNANDQQRDVGEPSIIADITREAMAKYKIDRTRVYVAGLSAGGAMAAIMGSTYPEIFSAVGVHSGLAVGAAHDVASAFGAMKNGASMSTKKARNASLSTRPIIVFHGDNDTTVHPENAKQVIAQFVGPTHENNLEIVARKNQTSAGRAFSTAAYCNAQGKTIAELWVLHGAAHAWSGGSAAGSYTDTKGPSASREMMRFFLVQTN